MEQFQMKEAIALHERITELNKHLEKVKNYKQYELCIQISGYVDPENSKRTIMLKPEFFPLANEQFILLYKSNLLALLESLNGQFEEL